MTLMPALFVGHGSPMNTLEENGFTESWSAFGRLLPRPRTLSGDPREDVSGSRH